MSTLNDTLKHAFDSFDKNDCYDWGSKQNAANQIEALILQEKIDLMEDILHNIEEYCGYPLEGKLEELTQQLNELTK